jgi:hypothetical protein
MDIGEGSRRNAPSRNLEEKEAATSYFGKVTDLKLIIKE